MECPFTIRRPAALRDVLREVARDIAHLAKCAADTPLS
jgi:hypothetical protein